MSERQIDLEGMFREIEVVYKKYGIPKGMGFVPDRLEIILERKGVDKFDLTYSEFFNYLSHDALNIAVETALNLMRQCGFTPEKTVRFENGVKIQISGDFQIASSLIIEVLLQNKGGESEINKTFDSMRKNYQIFHNLLDFYWEWNDEIQSKFKDYIKILTEITQKHAISQEIEAVIKKYTVKKP